MAIRNLRYEGDEILSKKSRDIDIIDDKILELANDMFDTMHKFEGVGLAGPQIVIDLYEEGEQYALINPVIISQKGEQIVDEGCLSFPNQFAKVRRAKEVVVEALDLKGKKVKIKGKDLLAQALQHEIDHLNGEVFVNKCEAGTLETITAEDKAKKNK